MLKQTKQIDNLAFFIPSRAIGKFFHGASVATADQLVLTSYESRSSGAGTVQLLHFCYFQCDFVKASKPSKVAVSPAREAGDKARARFAFKKWQDGCANHLTPSWWTLKMASPSKNSPNSKVGSGRDDFIVGKIVEVLMHG